MLDIFFPMFLNFTNTKLKYGYRNFFIIKNNNKLNYMRNLTQQFVIYNISITASPTQEKKNKLKWVDI